jgi:hypothetical protein
VTWPKKYTPADAPTEMLDLVGRLMPLLLAGDHPTCAALRAQYACAHVAEVELTGAGFFVRFGVPAESPCTEPKNFTGGHVSMQVDGVKHGAGCVLLVRDGVIDTLEGYTYDDEWPEHPLVLSLTDPSPCCPGAGTCAAAKDPG